MKVHTLSAFSNLQLYMHDTNDFIYFVDTNNLNQTILVRLPPVFVIELNETCVDYLVSSEVREVFDKMESHARVYLTDNDSRCEPSRLLRTTTNEYTKNAPESVGQFVEAVVAVVGIAKPDTGWQFIYNTVDVRAVEIALPKLDMEVVKTIDLFKTT
jgi:hypothetical protein